MNPGSERLSVTVQRPTQNTPWGFRLQGGADFTTPLSIQSVAGGSPADQYGVRPGDAVLSINNQPTEHLGHDDAKQLILMTGNHVAFVLERGSVTVWKPQVTPMSQIKPAEMNLNPTGPPGYQPLPDDQFIQRTSLAANKQESLKIGSTHNRSARPFAGFGGGSSFQPAQPSPPQQQYQYQAAPQQYQPPPQQHQQYQPPAPQQGGMVNAQYNTPISLYSDQNVADTYSAQSQAITGGMHGSHQQPQPSYQEQQPSHFEPPSVGASAGSVSGMRSVRAPVTKPPSERPQQQYMRCNGCDTLITGIFVRIKGNPMHAECFKCTTCGMNLKQQGYIEVGGKLYCEAHASQAAGAPQPNMVSVPVYR